MDKPHIEVDSQYRRNKEAILLQIVTAITMETGITIQQLQGPSRVRHIVDARHIFFHIPKLIESPRFSLDELGDYMNRSHSTVHTSRDKVDELMQFDKAFQKKYKQVTSKISLIMQPLSHEEKQAAIGLKIAQIDNLKVWLKEHHDNPYRVKIMQDLREHEIDLNKLQERKTKNQ